MLTFSCQQSWFQPTVQEYCSGTEICTARCYCTAGDGLVDSDIDEFLLNDVYDQGRV